MQRHDLGVVALSLMLGAAVCCTVGGCDKGTDGELWFAISGEVVHADTQEPLDSVWAALGDTLPMELRWYSETEGRFSIVSAGIHDQVFLYVGRSGYVTVADTLEDVRSDVTGLHYELEPAQ